MTTAKKQLLDQTFEAFLEECFFYKNPEILRAITDESLTGFGTTIFEKVTALEDLETILKLQVEQTKGVKVSYKTTPFSRHLSLDENTATMVDELTMSLGEGADAFHIYVRISAVLEYKNNKWLLQHWHASIPEKVENEEDTFGFEALKEKTVALEKEIADRTAELVEKNRELEIENALEKVRARSMAMKKASNLQEVIHVLHQQLLQLKIGIDGGSFIVINDEIQDEIICWGAGGTANTSEEVHIPKYDKPFYTNLINGIKARKGFFSERYTNEEKKDFFTFLLKHEPWSKLTDDEKKAIVLSLGGYVRSCCVSEHTSIFIINHLGTIFSEDDNDILKRFGKVFEQTYTRFLDLQKAEAQTRKAQVETALEKVRSRSLAMHKSEELLDVITVVSEQLQQLEFKFDTICFGENNKEGAVKFWLTSRGLQKPILVDVPPIKNQAVQRVVKAQKDGLKFLADVVTGKTYTEWNNHMLTNSQLQYLPEAAKTYLKETSGFARSSFFLKEIALYVMNYKIEPFSDIENTIFNRFAQVFDQSYTRFLDLQKAEAQTRKAQVETALEKVRSRSLAMHKSEELLAVIAVVSEQLQQLEFKFTHVSFANNELSQDYKFWTSSPGMPVPMRFKTPYIDIAVVNNLRKAQNEKATFMTDVLTKEEHVQWHNHLLNNVGAEVFTDEENEFIRSRGMARSIAINPNIILIVANYASIPYSETENTIIARFGQVFDQAYTRFLDLQKAEAQTREAQINLAVERVRARALAMYKSEEILELVFKLKQEIMDLDIPNVAAATIHLKEKDGNCTMWDLTTLEYAEGKLHQPMIVNYKLDEVDPDMFIRRVWENTKPYFLVVQDEKDFKRTLQFLRDHDRKNESDEVEAYIKNANIKYTYHPTVPLNNGRMCIDLLEPPSEEIEQILTKMGAAFDLAYTRFEDLKNSEKQTKIAQLNLIQIQEEKQRAEAALLELQVTQKQLIQSEKMASLGELTAGIAHEIQNPLNFVNNFSEVSNELLAEIQEERLKNKEIRDEELVSEILDDIKQNLEKINHHGKRADAIVKGMLQHSRSSSGTKEPTDINKLSDEYLRLAYHGLRAKDKSFNATLVTNYDENIGKINIIPQDIGRVILNLITNAFYATNEKQKSGIENYEPTVTILTKKLKNTIEISVADNGNGIPQKVLDKIFQPFFTTKPTGQGTGLGLSLAYDIIKAHQGELKVNTQENTGSVFTIQLQN